MSKQANSLLQAALKLSDKEREEMAIHLKDSLEPETEEEWEAAWKKELARRIKESDEGRVRRIPWSKVRAKLKEIVDGPAP